jgi:hypothetical protein
MKNDIESTILSDKIISKKMTESENEESKIMSKKAFFKDKYRRSLEIATKIEIQKLAKQHPDWSTKDVLVYIIKDYSPELPSQILVEMTQFITNEWDIVKTKLLAVA